MAPVSAPGSVLCASAALIDGGAGVRFTVMHRDQPEPAFVIRYQHVVYAYLNRCAHKLVELDWEPGQFFDADRRTLICATHGARYDPVNGACVDGPCRGARLVSLAVEEVGGVVRLAAHGASVVK